MKRIQWEYDGLIYDTQKDVAEKIGVSVRHIQKTLIPLGLVTKSFKKPPPSKYKYKEVLHTPHGTYSSMTELIRQEPLTNRGNAPSSHTIRARIQSKNYPEYRKEFIYQYPIALELKSDGGDFNIVAPDIVGCFASGKTKQEAIDNIKRAIELELYGLLNDSKAPPKACESLDLIVYAGWELSVVCVNIEPFICGGIVNFCESGGDFE